MKRLLTIMACALPFCVGAGTCVADDYSDMITALSPVGYWRLGENSGSTANDEMNVSNGTYKNEPDQGNSGAISGNYAPIFDGSDDWVSIPHKAAYLLDEGAISFWFRVVYAEPDEDEQDMSRKGIFTKDSTNYDTGGHISVMMIDTHIEARMQSTSNSYTLVSSNFTITDWNHALILFGPDGMEMYLNGNLEDWDSYSGGLGSTSGGTGNFEPIVIGANSWTSGNLSETPLIGYFEGQVDEVVLLDFTPTPTQITNLSSSDGGPPAGVRVVEWHVDPPIDAY